MAAKANDIRGEIRSILSKQKGISNADLTNVPVIDGMNPQIIAELFAFRKRNRIEERFADSFTDADLLRIYNNLATKKAKSLTPNMKESLLLTLYRYNW